TPSTGAFTSVYASCSSAIASSACACLMAASARPTSACFTVTWPCWPSARATVPRASATFCFATSTACRRAASSACACCTSCSVWVSRRRAVRALGLGPRLIRLRTRAVARQRHLGAGGPEIGLGHRHRRPRLRHAGLEVARVHAQQQVVAFHRLVVAHAHLDHVAADLGADRGDDPLDVGVVGGDARGAPVPDDGAPDDG